MTDEELAQEMERRGFPTIAATIRRPAPSEDLSLEEACPWLVEDGRHDASGKWVPDPLPRQLRAAS